MADKNILLDALDTCWRRLRDEWDRARRKNSESAIHDLRVASRRLLAVLDTLESLVEDSGIGESRRRVKKLLQALSPLRDVQVQSAYVSKMVSPYPPLEDFKTSLEKKEQRTVKKMRKLLKKPLGLGHAIARAKRHTKGRELETPAIVGIVDKRYGEVLERAEHVDRSNVATIHEMRLSFKRFRYTAELVQPLIRKRLTASHLKQFHEFQTMMGDIQDMEVLSSKLVKWAGKDEQRADGLKPVLEELARQKEKRIDTFMDSFSQSPVFLEGMNLYLLRHAIAVPRETPGIEEKDRPLTKEGRRKMKAIAEGMRTLELEFGRILSSPFQRAMETAEIVAEVFRMEVEICTALASGGNQRELITSLAKLSEENLLLVGHEPDLSQFVSLLISGNSEGQIELKKGGLCKLASDHLIFGRSATLEWLLQPSQLRQMGQIGRTR